MNVPNDWNAYWTSCEYCGRRYHESDGCCSCIDSLGDCHCGERDWDVDRHGEIRCSRCGSKPGETYTVCSCCGKTFKPEELEVELEGGEPWAYCERCLYEEVA